MECHASGSAAQTHRAMIPALLRTRGRTGVPMSRFEWMGEQVDPGRVGGFDAEDLGRPRRVSPFVACFKFAITFLAFIIVPLVALFSNTVADPLVGIAAFGGLLVYVVLSTVFTPRPDLTNIGWAGGLIDNPFRYSDDWNRALLGLLILTGPGRFLGSGVVDMYHLLAGD
jgi:hypothetical protein